MYEYRVNKGKIIIWKEVVVACVKILSQHSSEHRKPKKYTIQDKPDKILLGYSVVETTY
jgi:hypothetical protein